MRMNEALEVNAFKLNNHKNGAVKRPKVDAGNPFHGFNRILHARHLPLSLSRSVKLRVDHGRVIQRLAEKSIPQKLPTHECGVEGTNVEAISVPEKIEIEIKPIMRIIHFS